ncbi:UNVERIFIED_CONTAM: hypothetical protein NY603_30670, partial [Bacteroidetes bacterium 56_B9]
MTLLGFGHLWQRWARSSAIDASASISLVRGVAGCWIRQNRMHLFILLIWSGKVDLERAADDWFLVAQELQHLRV